MVKLTPDEQKKVDDRKREIKCRLATMTADELIEDYATWYSTSIGLSRRERKSRNAMVWGKEFVGPRAGRKQRRDAFERRNVEEYIEDLARLLALRETFEERGLRGFGWPPDRLRDFHRRRKK